MLKTAAFGGWGGFTDKDRDQFATTFGSALKVGDSSFICVANNFPLGKYRKDTDTLTGLGNIVRNIPATTRVGF